MLIYAGATSLPQDSLNFPMTCPDNQSTLPAGTVLSGSNDGFGATPRLEARQKWRTPIKRQAYLGMNAARPSESAQVDIYSEERRLCESNSYSNGSFIIDVSK
jgi:hypothetical protein